jgi:hypothetical protein
MTTFVFILVFVAGVTVGAFGLVALFVVCDPFVHAESMRSLNEKPLTRDYVPKWDVDANAPYCGCKDCEIRRRFESECS